MVTVYKIGSVVTTNSALIRVAIGNTIATSRTKFKTLAGADFTVTAGKTFKIGLIVSGGTANTFRVAYDDNGTGTNEVFVYNQTIATGQGIISPVYIEIPASKYLTGICSTAAMGALVIGIEE